MENASKALIVAGAILISILLISVGILLFNSTRGTTDTAKTTGNLLETQVEKTGNAIEEGLDIIEFTFIEYGPGPKPGTLGDIISTTLIKAEKDMTWYQFVNSSYNDAYKFKLGNGKILRKDFNINGNTDSRTVKNKKGNVIQTKDMKIEKGNTYFIMDVE